MRHIVIVGAGILGACLAFRLSGPGVQLTVVEAANPASGASGASFGWINASFFANPDHHRLRVEAMAAHHRLSRDLPMGAQHWPGCLWYEEAGAGLDARESLLKELGYPVERLTRAQIAAAIPDLGEVPDEALLFPGEGAVDPAHLARVALAASGARVMRGLAVERLIEEAGRITGVQTVAGPIVGDTVILTAGTGTPALLAPLGQHLPMLRRPGLILRTNRLGPVLPHILATKDLELRQDVDGSLFVPFSTNHQGDTATQIAETAEALSERAMEQIRRILPGQRIICQDISLAHRPVPGDGLPVLGAAGVPGLWLAVMHSGVTLAALTAEGLRSAILGNGLPGNWAAYGLDRPGLSAPT
jgi:glycine/D-amino acid oxidase-like deaminating enzyme